jgi:hypothetical protein
LSRLVGHVSDPGSPHHPDREGERAKLDRILVELATIRDSLA